MATLGQYHAGAYRHSHAAVYGEDTDHIGVVGSVITVLQMIPLFLSIVIVEKRASEKFDENGSAVIAVASSTQTKKPP